LIEYGENPAAENGIQKTEEIKKNRHPKMAASRAADRLRAA